MSAWYIGDRALSSIQNFYLFILDQVVRPHLIVISVSMSVQGAAYVEANREWRAGDIGMSDMTCGWLKGFMSVNVDLGAGRAFLRSLYQQYAEWGVDFGN